VFNLTSHPPIILLLYFILATIFTALEETTMSKLKVGQKAPEFKLPGSDGKTHQLSDYQGKNVVLYFYPKDDTPG